MDAYIRRLQRETAEEPRSPELARYIATLERALGISDRPASYEEAQHILKTAKKLKSQAVRQIVMAAYQDVPTPVGEPVEVIWNMPSQLRVNWYTEYPPYSEVWDFGEPGRESNGINVLEATRSPLRFNILDPEEPESAAIYGVPRWLFRLSDDELPVFESVRQYLPEEYVAGMRWEDVPAVMEG
jgi:hypothetical protein